MRYKTSLLRCLGVDPGIANTGVCVVSRLRRGYCLVASELIKTSRETGAADRLFCIYRAVARLISENRVDVVAVERVFHNKNISSSITTGMVIGAVSVAALHHGTTVIELTPQQVKRASGLGGSAKKAAVQKVMCRLLKAKHLNPHVSDAAACAIAGLLNLTEWQKC